MDRDEIEVRALRSLDALAPLRGDIDALNLAARRPCPYSTYEYVRAMFENDEYAAPGDELLFLCALRGGRLVGYLPLKRSRGRSLGVPFDRIGWAVSHDADRPHLVARAEDERACADAFIAHLARRERWSSLELTLQDESSPLWPVPGLPAWRFHARQYPNAPNTTIPLGHPTLREFFRALPRDFRNTVSRLSRRVANAGHVECVSCHDRAAARPLLELYLDVERRSWKGAASAGLDRDPRRLAFFQSLCSPEQPLQLAFDFVLLDGVPIAGIVGGIFAGDFHALHTAYDSAYAGLSPGYLMWLLAIRHGIVENLRSYNLQSGYSYYKARWNGVSTPTWAVQVFRVPSVPYLRARAGELKRRLLGGGEELATFNEAKRAVDESAGQGARPARTEHARRAEAVLGALARDGVRMERLSGADLAEALPFALDESVKVRQRSA